MKLREEVKEVLLLNKIGGAAIDVIPFIDLFIQRFIIKKNAIKKVSEIFGIKAQYIDEENEKKEKRRFSKLYLSR